MNTLYRGRLVVCGLLVCALAGAGCGKDKSKISGLGDPQAVLGDWLEYKIPDEEQGGTRRANPENAPRTANLRQVTVSADGSFKVQMVGADKKPVANQAIAGKWSWQNQRMVFSAESNTLPENLKTLAPARSSGIDAGIQPEQFRVVDQSGQVVIFRRPK